MTRRHAGVSDTYRRSPASRIRLIGRVEKHPSGLATVGSIQIPQYDHGVRDYLASSLFVRAISTPPCVARESKVRLALRGPVVPAGVGRLVHRNSASGGGGLLVESF